MFVVVFPRGYGWYLSFDAGDRVIGPHWTQTEDKGKATQFTDRAAASVALAAY